MFKIDSIEDISHLRETATLECKLASGKNGKGELPRDFWPTYSSFANTYGGIVLLGVKEKDRCFE
jgi:predicted HTH transcriptional regulator